MSHMNKPNVNQTFEICKQYLKSAVPPCVVTTDTPTHYECSSDNGKEKHVFGYVIAHEHIVTFGFCEDIKEGEMKQLVSDRILKMMGHGHHRIEIRDIHEHELANDLRRSEERRVGKEC